MGTAPRLSGYEASLILSMIHEKCVPDEAIGQGETTAAWDTMRCSTPASATGRAEPPLILYSSHRHHHEAAALTPASSGNKTTSPRRTTSPAHGTKCGCLICAVPPAAVALPNLITKVDVGELADQLATDLSELADLIHPEHSYGVSLPVVHGKETLLAFFYDHFVVGSHRACELNARAVLVGPEIRLRRWATRVCSACK